MLISIFEVGSCGGVSVVFWVLFKIIVTTVTVTTGTCHHCFGKDKRVHNPLLGGNNFLVCELKFCNVTTENVPS